MLRMFTLALGCALLSGAPPRPRRARRSRVRRPGGRRSVPLAGGRQRRAGDGLGEGGERQDRWRAGRRPALRRPLQADALTIAEAKDRIPAPELSGGQIYNFWQDADHVRGIWRQTIAGRTTPSAEPALDDGARPRRPGQGGERQLGLEGRRLPVARRDGCCLITLSDGGEDAVTCASSTSTARPFVAGGFDLPHSKQRVAWDDPDTLLVARDWTPGELTASGYPFIVKR